MIEKKGKMRNQFEKVWQTIKDLVYTFDSFVHRFIFSKIFKKRTSGFKQIKRNKSLFIFCMLLIPVVHFIIFWIYVNIDSLLIAFQRIDEETGLKYFTDKNFRLIFELFRTSNSQMWQAIKNTLITWVFTTLFMFPLSILWSFFIYKKILLGSFYRVMFYIPSIISGVALAVFFKYLIVTDGPIGYLYKLLTSEDYVPSFLTEKEYAMKTILIYIFWTGFGGNLILLNGAMGRISKEMMESAFLDGIGMWRELFNFILPLSWPTLSTLIIFSFTGLFTSSGPILLLTEGQGETYTISYWIFELVYSKGSSGLPFMAAAIGILFTAIGFPIVLVIRHFINKIYEDVEF
jgi:ABC-type sugar transport system permease subunit